MSTMPPPDDPRAGVCTSCGSALAADQRYCLTCGARREHARRPFQDALAPALATPSSGVVPAAWAAPAPPQSGPQTSTLLAALACVLVAFGVGILVGGGNDAPAQQPVVIGGAPTASAATPTTTTAAADATSTDTTDTVSSSDSKASDDTVPDTKLSASDKKAAEEIQKTPAKVPKAKTISSKEKSALNSKNPDTAREASQALPDSVSTGG